MFLLTAILSFLLALVECFWFIFEDTFNPTIVKQTDVLSALKYVTRFH